MDRRAKMTDPMIQDWIEHIREVRKKQEQIIVSGKKFYIPFLVLPTQIVKSVFILCDYYDIGHHTRYLSLQIFEKYMCNYFWKHFKENEEKANSINWRRVCSELTCTVKLYLVLSIQLASKMDSISMNLDMSQVIDALKLLDPRSYYHPKGLVPVQKQVFHYLDYQIPLVTPIDCIEILLLAIGYRKKEQFFDTSVEILDLTYLQHQQLFSQLHFLVNGTLIRTEANKIKDMIMESDVLFLCASVIITTFLVLNIKISRKEYVLRKLEELVKISQYDISVFSNVIFSMIAPNSKFETKTK